MKIFDLNFVLTVYADAEKADADQSKTLSAGEALTLALALSVDGFAAGFGWGLTHINYIELILLSLVSNLPGRSPRRRSGQASDAYYKTRLLLDWRAHSDCPGIHQAEVLGGCRRSNGGDTAD